MRQTRIYPVITMCITAILCFGCEDPADAGTGGGQGGGILFDGSARSIHLGRQR